MASVFLYHVVGDLTVGKPELLEFEETGTLEDAIRAIGESADGAIPIWRRKPQIGVTENSRMRHHRFVGILNSLDIVSFLARDGRLQNQEKALKTPVSEVVSPNNSLLKQVDPGTRLIDALEMMKQGVRCLLVPKSAGWRGTSKRFSILYNGKWLKNIDCPGNTNVTPPLTTSSSQFCCLSREDVIRFLIGCLGALAPLPLTSISSLGAINPNYISIEASSPAIDAAVKLPGDRDAIAVVEPEQDGARHKIIGEISASKVWKCDYVAAACALADLSAGQFVMGMEDDHVKSRSPPDFQIDSTNNMENKDGGSTRPRKFSSRNIGFFSNPSTPKRSIYRGRSAPLTCKATNSLASVMAQMLSHRASHVWVTDDEHEDGVVGVVGYVDILAAVTRSNAAVLPKDGFYGGCVGTECN